LKINKVSFYSGTPPFLLHQSKAFSRHVGAMAWREWPSVFQKHGASLADEITKWLFAIFW
jgi:hypothetical protein